MPKTQRPIAVGSTHYGLAAAGTLLAIVVLGLLRYPERFLKGHLYRVVTIETSTGETDALVRAARTCLDNRGQIVLDVQGSRDVQAGITLVHVHVRTTGNFQLHDVLETVGALEGVRKVSWSATH